MKNLRLVFIIIVMFTLAGCGGGGSSSPTPVTMVLKVSTTGTLPAESSISGVSFTITLPAGVTVTTDQNGNVATGAMVPSGVISPATATSAQIYTPAGTAPGKLNITVASTVAEGFGTGEFFSITVTRPAGSTAPIFTNSNLSNFAPADLLYQPIAGITGTLTVQ